MSDTPVRSASQQDLALVARSGSGTRPRSWVRVLKGLDGFEGRSSLRTWNFRILVNTAKTRGQREARSLPFSSVWAADPTAEPSVDPDRFLPLSRP